MRGVYAPRGGAAVRSVLRRRRRTPPPPHAALNFPRYKLVVQAMLGEQKSQGVRIASRCLWDVESDNVATFAWQSDSMWCTVMCWGLYME